jgi:hypothetical protein
LYVNRIVRTLPTTAIPARNPAPHRIADSPRPEAQKRRDHYNDLGATIIGPAADLNLGIKTFLNGALMSDIVHRLTLAAVASRRVYKIDGQARCLTSAPALFGSSLALNCAC